VTLSLTSPPLQAYYSKPYRQRQILLAALLRRWKSSQLQEAPVSGGGGTQARRRGNPPPPHLAPVTSSKGLAWGRGGGQGSVEAAVRRGVRREGGRGAQVVGLGRTLVSEGGLY
jgi:hypothetical protein